MQRALALLTPALLMLSLAACGGESGPDLATIQVTPNPIALAQLQSSQLQVSVLDSDGQLLTGIAVTFASTNTDVASVSSTGLVTGARAGTGGIRVSAGDLDVEVPVTVTAVSNQIVVSPSPAVVAQNATLQLTATVLDLNGVPIPNAPLTYVSGTPSLATVSNGGLVDPAGPAGQVLITVTSGSLTASATVAITQVPTALVVTPNPVTMGKAATLPLSAQVHDLVDAPVPGVAFTYQSSNTTLATVTSAGQVVGQGATGSLNVTVSGAGLSTQVPITLVDIGSPAGVLDNTSSLPGMLAYSADVSTSGEILIVGTDNSGGSATLARATLANRTLQALPVTGSTFATDVAFSPSGATAWLANVTGGSATEITPASGSVLGSLTGATAPTNQFSIVMGQDGNTAYMAGNSVFYEFGIGTRAVTRMIGINSAALTLVRSPVANRYFVTGDGLVQEVDPLAGTVRDVGTVTAKNLAVSADGARLFLVNEFESAVQVVNSQSGSSEGTWTLPCAPWGISMTLDGTKLFATCTGAGQILVIDAVAGTVLTTITVGGAPRRISFTPDGLIALVTNDALGVHFIR